MTSQIRRRLFMPGLTWLAVIALTPLSAFGHEDDHDDHFVELPTNVDQLIDAAFIAQSRHDFEQALELTRDAIERRPNNDQAWLLLASIHLVRGEATEAGQACDRLRHVPLIVTMTCRARVALAMNDFARSKQQLDAVLSVLDEHQTRSDWLAWSLSVAGDLAVAADNMEQAIDYYSNSLELVENSQVRAALSDTYISGDRLKDASDILDADVLDLALQIRRLIVATRLGHADDFSAEIRDTDRKFASWIEAEDWQHAREMARFYLDVVDRPDHARRLAVINFVLQKEPEDFRLLERTGERLANLKRRNN